MEGWIKLHRRILGWEWYNDISTKTLFIHLLLVANHKDQKWRGIEIKRGEKLTSRNKLSDETGLSIQQVRTSLNKLKSTSEITIKTTNKYTLIKLNNYDSHQQDNQQTNTQATSKQPASNHKQECNNEENEKNNKKNIIKKINPFEEFESVLMTKEECRKLDEKFGADGFKLRCENLHNYIESKGKKYKSHYHTILVWDKKNN